MCSSSAYFSGQTYAGTVAAVRRSKEPSPDFLAWLGLGVVW